MSNGSVFLLTGGAHHDFPAIAQRLFSIISAAGFTVELSEDREILASLPQHNFKAVVICTQGGHLTEAQENGLTQYVHTGRGFVGLHGASASWKENQGYIAMLGSRFLGHGPQVEFEIQATDTAHQIIRHFYPFRMTTELYQIESVGPKFQTLVHANWLGQMQPIAYIKDYGAGKVFYLSPGHQLADFDYPEWQQLFIRGLRWSMGILEKPALKTGVIGYGGACNMGRQHLKEMQDSGFMAVGACDIDPKRTTVAKVDFPDIVTYADHKQMLDKSEAELITVILPHSVHSSVAIDVLNSGRHCIVEKPMAISSNEVNAMIATADKKGKMLSVYHNRRWDGDFLAIDELVRRRKAIGDVFKIETAMAGFNPPGSSWRSSKQISGGIHFDWGAHIIFWALQLIDSPIEWVAATTQKRVWTNITNEDHIEAYVRFKNGATLDFELSNIASAPRPRWRILGTRGAIVDHWWAGSFELYQYGATIKTEVPAKIKYAPAQGYRYYQNIADHLRLGDPLEITARKAGRVVHLLHTMDRAAASGKQEIVPGEE